MPAMWCVSPSAQCWWYAVRREERTARPFSSRRRRRVGKAKRAHLSLQPHVGGLDDAAPSRNFLAHEACHGFWIAADRVGREIVEALAHVRRANRFGDIGTDLVDNIARRVRRRGDGKPCRRGKPRQRLSN